MRVDLRLMILFFSCLCLVSGCQSEKRPEGMPPLHPCRITVLQDGRPLEGATVRFHATRQEARWSSSGVTDAKGVAEIVTQGQYKGAPEGTYKVTVSKEETVSLATPEQLAAIEKARAENPKWFDSPKIKQEVWQLVEKNFTLADETTLEMTVSKGRNSANFDVEKAVRVKQNVSME